MRCKRKLSSSFSTTSEDVNPIMFFKIYIPDRSSQQLQLPSTFVKKLNYILPPKSILMRFVNKTWSVDVEEVGDTLVFQKGWSDFVNDSSLEPGDFLVFSYLGAAKFDVKIFGQSGVEKINLYALQQCKTEREDFQIVPHDQFQLTNQHAEEMNILAEYEQLHDRYEMTNQLGEEMNKLADDERLRNQSEQTDQNGDAVNKLADGEHLHDQYEQANQHGEEMNKSEDEEQSEEEEQSTSEDSDYHYESEGVSDENHYRYESEGVSDENKKQKSRKKSDENEKQKSRKKSDENEKQKSSKKKSTGDKSKSTADKKRPKVRDKPKHRIWNGDGTKNRVPDVSFESDYPHFKMGVLPVYSCRASLNVPMPFARKYMKPGKMRTTLQTLDNSWPVTLTTYTNGCCKISSGWLAFVRDNCIKVGDICVFELIDLNLFTFKVSIFPMRS